MAIPAWGWSLGFETHRGTVVLLFLAPQHKPESADLGSETCCHRLLFLLCIDLAKMLRRLVSLQISSPSKYWCGGKRWIRKILSSKFSWPWTAHILELQLKAGCAMFPHVSPALSSSLTLEGHSQLGIHGLDLFLRGRLSDISGISAVLMPRKSELLTVFLVWRKHFNRCLNVSPNSPFDFSGRWRLLMLCRIRLYASVLRMAHR